jgi:hypothetical protein
LILQLREYRITAYGFARTKKSCTREHVARSGQRGLDQMPYVDLITRNSLARALNADPRAKFLKDLIPLAYLLSGRTRLPLYAADLVKKLQANQEGTEE